MYIPGISSLALSIITESQILAFVGLGLTFWGALFFLVRPVAYVRGNLLNITAVTMYSTIDKIVKDLNYKGRGTYIPPYPKEVYLPEHLKGLKETIAFISADASAGTPSIEELASGKFITKNPKGICLIPPGSSLLDHFEMTTRAKLVKMNLEEMCLTLPQLIVENFRLAKEIEMKTEDNRVYLKMTDSIYKNLYLEQSLKSVRILGCPLASAIASAIAKTSGKPVTIQSTKISTDAQSIEISFHLAEG